MIGRAGGLREVWDASVIAVSQALSPLVCVPDRSRGDAVGCSCVFVCLTATDVVPYLRQGSDRCPLPMAEGGVDDGEEIPTVEGVV